MEIWSHWWVDLGVVSAMVGFIFSGITESISRAHIVCQMSFHFLHSAAYFRSSEVSHRQLPGAQSRHRRCKPYWSTIVTDIRHCMKQDDYASLCNLENVLQKRRQRKTFSDMIILHTKSVTVPPKQSLLFRLTRKLKLKHHFSRFPVVKRHVH